MIKLKDKINKSVALRTIRRDAEKMYKKSWQPELQIEAYVKGAEAILNYLHIPRVSNSVCPECGYPKFKKSFEDFERCEGCEWTSK